VIFRRSPSPDRRKTWRWRFQVSCCPSKGLPTRCSMRALDRVWRRRCTRSRVLARLSGLDAAQARMIPCSPTGQWRAAAPLTHRARATPDFGAHRLMRALGDVPDSHALVSAGHGGAQQVLVDGHGFYAGHTKVTLQNEVGFQHCCTRTCLPQLGQSWTNYAFTNCEY